MRQLDGGMAFRMGRPIRLRPPPVQLPVASVQLRLSGQATVHSGDSVHAGQPLAMTAQGMPVDVSPLTGVVRQSGDTAVLLKPIEDHTPSAIRLPPPLFPAEPSLTGWLETLRQVGRWRQPGIPADLIGQLDAARGNPPRTLICIGLDRFAPYPDRSSLLMSFAHEVVTGTQLLGRLVGARRRLLLAARRSRVIGRLRRRCRNARVRLVPVEPAYPLADPMLVAYHHARGRRLALGQNPMDAGVMMIDPWTAIRLARWVELGQLDVATPMFIGRADPSRPMTAVWALTGQRLGALDPLLQGTARQLQGRVVIGHPMQGHPPRPQTWIHAEGDSLAAWPRIFDDEMLVSVLSQPTPRPAKPCISCGWCADACPTRLRPAHLARLSIAPRTAAGDRQLAANLPWCIDCGLCTHICPSDLPLAETLRTARRRIEATRGGAVRIRATPEKRT